MTPTFLRTDLKFLLPQSSDKKVFLFDIETNGFYDDVNKIHCIVIKDVKTGQTFSYRPDSISNALIHLDSADVLVGHNIIFYDIPVIEKLFPDVIDFSCKEVVDTLVCVRLLWPKEKLYEIDQKDYNHVPTRLMGSASLEAWGHRFKDYKGDFKDFENFSQEMLDYCIQDVSVSFKLHQLLCDQAGPYERSLRLEHDLARCIERQIRSGFGFDVDAANDLVDELEKRKGELEVELREAFPAKDEGDWFVPRVTIRIKVMSQAKRFGGQGSLSLILVVVSRSVKD